MEDSIPFTVTMFVLELDMITCNKIENYKTSELSLLIIASGCDRSDLSRFSELGVHEKVFMFALESSIRGCQGDI
jgi:hypothetical protein